MQKWGEMRSAVVVVPTADDARQLLTRGLDYGCRPRARRQPDGRYRLVVYGPTDDLLDELGRSFEVTVHQHPQVIPPTADQLQFADGVIPLGFGAQRAIR